MLMSQLGGRAGSKPAKCFWLSGLSHSRFQPSKPPSDCFRGAKQTLLQGASTCSELHLSLPLSGEPRCQGHSAAPTVHAKRARHWALFAELQCLGSLGIAALLSAANPLSSTALLPKDPSQLLLSAVLHGNEKCNPASGSSEKSL